MTKCACGNVAAHGSTQCGACERKAEGWATEQARNQHIDGLQAFAQRVAGLSIGEMPAKEAADLLRSLVGEAKALTDECVDGVPDPEGCRL
jgi:hypothetical protein